MADEKTSVQRMVEALLKTDLREFVVPRRSRGLSWRRIAGEMREATGGAVDLTGETVRRWFPDLADDDGDPTNGDDEAAA